MDERMLNRSSILDFRPLLEIENKDEMFKMFINSEITSGPMAEIMKFVIDKVGYDSKMYEVIGGILKNASRMKSLSMIDLEKGPYIDVTEGINVCSRDMDIVKIKDKYIINNACSYFITDSYIIGKNEDGSYFHKRTNMNVGYESDKAPIIVDTNVNEDGTITATGRVCMFNLIGEAAIGNNHMFNSAPIVEHHISMPITSIMFEGEGQKMVCINQYNRGSYENDSNSIIAPYFFNHAPIKDVNVYEIANDPEKYLSFSISDIVNML